MRGIPPLIVALLLHGCASAAQPNIPSATPSLKAPSPTAVPPTARPLATPTQHGTAKPWETSFFSTSGTAECPEFNPSLPLALADLPPLDPVSGCYPDPGLAVLGFLNRGGSFSALAAAVDLAFPDASPPPQLSQLELTGDDTPEIAFALSDLYIYGCDSGQYVLLLKEPIPDIGNSCDAPTVEQSLDMNLNGRPDVLVHTFFLPWHLWQIFEWQGTSFQNVLSAECPSLEMPGKACAEAAQADVVDMNGDGTIELLVRGGYTEDPLFPPDLPWPPAIQTFSWDGARFALHSVEYVND